MSVRVRFAPSPTGPLHIGGMRTALYNYLFAKQQGGSFILRIEDTDQDRYIEGAEEYICEALEWANLHVDEGPKLAGNYGPYRQSERTEIYQKYVDLLIEKGWAYESFDSPEELDSEREKAKQEGEHSWQYSWKNRNQLKNSFTLSKEEVKSLKEQKVPFVVRFIIPNGETVEFTDIVRGNVSFQSNVLDDKVLIKADGLPTYHFANVVDDHLMEITHVIRGEEWLSSTPLHVLLYNAFGWETPQFAHLPLILKPTGKGKLSKRDGAKFGFPVFPLTWEDKATNEVWMGYRETGFLPTAFNNYMAFLGWNPGTEKEFYNLDELISDFSLEKVSKSSARFDYEKGLWFNQQHLQKQSNASIAAALVKLGISAEVNLEKVAQLYKERVHLIAEIPMVSNYLFGEITHFDEKMINKKWKTELAPQIGQLKEELSGLLTFTAAQIEAAVKAFMEDQGLGFGQVLPALRLAICGTLNGPSIFDIMEVLGQDKCIERLNFALVNFEDYKIKQA